MAQVEPNIEFRDDSHVTIQISLAKGPVSKLLSLNGDDTVVVKIPITFALEECSWFGLFCDEEHRFSVVGYVLPKNVGTVKALFVGRNPSVSSAPRLWPYPPRLHLRALTHCFPLWIKG